MQVLRVVASSILVCGGVFVSGAPAHAADLDVCASGCTYTTIQAAVTAADPNDSINVQAGTYNETTPILIAKPLTIKGAGVGSTIVDGGGAGKSIFEIRPALPAADPADNGPIELSDMTLRNAGATTANVRLLVKQVTTGITAINLQRLDINASGTSYGIYADGGITGTTDREAPEFTLTDSKIKGHTNNGVGLDAWRGKSTIADTDLYEGTTGRSAILVMNEYTTSRIPDPVIIKDNASVGRLAYIKNYVGPTFGGYDDIQVTGNAINGLAGGTGTDCNSAAGPDCGILVSSNAPSSGGAAQMDKVLVTGNSMRGDGVSTNTTGVYIGGDVKDAKINENNIVGLGVGIDVAQNQGQSAEAVAAHHNRLFADRVGIRNATSTAVDATENWWGCQDGPTSPSPYCSSVENTPSGTVGTSTWVVTTATAGSTTLETEGSTNVTGTLGKLNNGAPVTLPSFFVGLTSAFSADQGTVDPESGVLDGTYSDSTTYTAPSNETTDTVLVTLDREEFPAAVPTGGTALAAYGDEVVTGEPVPLSITVENAEDTGGDDGDSDGDSEGDGDGGNGSNDDNQTLPDTGGPASATLLNLGMALLSIVTGGALIAASRKRKAASMHLA
ncbi:hypothetical protein [Aeromicrobium sp.]